MLEFEWMGFEAIEKKLRVETLLHPPIRATLDAMGEKITYDAEGKAPAWDRFRIAASSFRRISKSGDTYELEFGFANEIAVYLEYGTGTLAEGPGPKKGRRHYPPPAALDPWAKAHGWPNGWVLSRHIGDRGGLEPRYFLRDATEAEMARSDSHLDDLYQAIERIWVA